MKKRFLALLLAALTVLSLLTGCGGSKSGTETPSTPDDTSATEEPKVLTIGISSDLMTLDPQAHAQTVTDNMFQMISVRLFRRANDMSLAP